MLGIAAPAFLSVKAPESRPPFGRRASNGNPWPRPSIDVAVGVGLSVIQAIAFRNGSPDR